MGKGQKKETQNRAKVEDSKAAAVSLDDALRRILAAPPQHKTTKKPAKTKDK